MSNLTASQIKAILEAATYPENVEINSALMQNDERRKYPSIDVQNITGTEQLKGFPTTTFGQTFLVHLFYRYRSFGEQEESKIKALEDVIFGTIDENTNFSTEVKITITQGWRRDSETFPVRRSHSTLTVTTEEIKATDPATGATPGDKIDIIIPNVGTFDVISIPIDQFGLFKQFDLTQSAEEIFTKIYEFGILSVELALSPSQEETLQSQVIDGDDVTVTLNLNGITRDYLVNYTDIAASSSREVVRTTILSMDVKGWS